MFTRSHPPLALAAVLAAVTLAAGCGSTTSSSSSTSAGAATQSSASTGAASTTASSNSASSTATAATATTALTAVYRAETAALATYRNVVTKLGSIRPFVNVIDSEQQHVATVKGLMTAHGVSIPPAAPGAAVPSTRTLACALGVRTEQGVIALYDQYLPQIKSYPDLVLAFGNLRAASANSHLPAFQHCS